MRLREKRKGLLFTVIVILAGLILASVPATSRTGEESGLERENQVSSVRAQEKRSIVDGQIIVQLKQKRDASQVAARHHLTALDALDDSEYLFGFSDSRTTGEVIAALEADQDVISAEPNALLKLLGVDQENVAFIDQRSVAFIDQRSVAFIDGVSPEDYFGQYALDLIQAREAQAFAKGRGVTVAVIDTGIDDGHPAIRRVTAGFDFVAGDPDPSEEGFGDTYGHGTMVAGLITLVAPDATIMPLRVFESNGMGSVFNVRKAIRYATGMGADVINMSFGMSDEDRPVENALAFAARRGVVLIAAAGNRGTSMPQYPAGYNEYVMAVGATDEYDQRADFSNFGRHVDVAAPGVAIYSAYPGRLWAWWSGTSFSAAFASGTAALVMSARRRGDPVQAIEATAVNVGGGLGHGRIDALAAVTY